MSRRKISSDGSKLADKSFRQWGFGKPVIGVAGLNPHAGENGMFGREEIDEIAPAVREAVSLGIDARGPLPADSIFNRAIKGDFDVVLVMYHVRDIFRSRYMVLKRA